MKKIFAIVTAIAFVSLTSCGQEEKLFVKAVKHPSAVYTVDRLTVVGGSDSYSTDKIIFTVKEDSTLIFTASDDRSPEVMVTQAGDRVKITPGELYYYRVAYFDNLELSIKKRK